MSDPIETFFEYLFRLPVEYWQGFVTAISLFIVWKKFADRGWIIAIILFIVLIFIFGGMVG